MGYLPFEAWETRNGGDEGFIVMTIADDWAQRERMGSRTDMAECLLCVLIFSRRIPRAGLHGPSLCGIRRARRKVYSSHERGE